MIKKTTTKPKPVLDLRFEGIGNAHHDFPDNSVEVELTKGSSDFNFSFEIRQDEFCCGLFSLGSFSIDSNSTVITADEKAEAVKALFIEVLKKMKPNKSEITLMLTTISNNACDVVKNALKDGTLFTKVKSFKNLNSGNNNDLYISN